MTLAAAWTTSEGIAFFADTVGTRPTDSPKPSGPTGVGQYPQTFDGYVVQEEALKVYAINPTIALVGAGSAAAIESFVRRLSVMAADRSPREALVRAIEHSRGDESFEIAAGFYEEGTPRLCRIAPNENPGLLETKESVILGSLAPVQAADLRDFLQTYGELGTLEQTLVAATAATVSALFREGGKMLALGIGGPVFGGILSSAGWSWSECMHYIALSGPALACMSPNVDVAPSFQFYTWVDNDIGVFIGDTEDSGAMPRLFLNHLSHAPSSWEKTEGALGGEFCSMIENGLNNPHYIVFLNLLHQRIVVCSPCNRDWSGVRVQHPDGRRFVAAHEKIGLLLQEMLSANWTGVRFISMPPPGM